MDEIDQVQKKETMIMNFKISHASKAISAVDFGKMSLQQQKNIENSECIDCEDTISHARRKAVPNSIRCCYCQSEIEGN
jgi:RNA polymerase-binding transcription factor DksA